MNTLVLTPCCIAFALLGAGMCRAQCQPFWVGLQPKNVGSMVTIDNGSGPVICVTGFGNSISGYADPVRFWNGHEYVPVGSGLNERSTGLYALDDGFGIRLYHRTTSPTGQISMKRFNGSTWEPVPKGMHVNPSPSSGTSIEPRFSTRRPGIAGLYAHMFDYSTPLATNQVARWESGGWKKLGGCSAGGGLLRMEEYFVEGRWNLVVSGYFAEFAGLTANYLVRWDGSQWHSMSAPGAANAICTWDDGNGPILYTGWMGTSNLSPLGTQGIARWNGRTWESVGGGLYDPQPQAGGVWDMKVFDDGTGPALFVLGRFDRAGGVNGIPARNIAKWDGQQWHALGAGVSGGPNNLAVADDGRGPSLFVEGLFTSAGGGTTMRIAQYVGCAGSRQCYADCDNSRSLTANDFMCFLNKYAINDPYANCDLSPIHAINAGDFQCYLNKFAQGCSLP